MRRIYKDMMLQNVDTLIRFRQYVARFSNQAEAAKALGIKSPHLSSMYLGKRPVTKPVMEKIGIS
jgi:hypothetical protein